MQIRSVSVALLLLLYGQPSLSDGDKCFQNKLRFFGIFHRMNGSQFEKSQIIERACKELRQDGMTDSITAFEQIGRQISSKIVTPGFGLALGAFDRLGGSVQQRVFRDRLEEIRRIKNPIDRIEEVYELVSKVGGYKNLGPSSLTPGAIIDRAQKTGKAGECIHFAALLQAGLLRVARHSESKGYALGPDDFSSEIKTANVADLGLHAWVRINLPQHNPRGLLQDFRHFDLDTTWYPSQFTPLFPRRSGLSEKSKTTLLAQCKQIVACLLSTSRTGTATEPLSDAMR